MITDASDIIKNIQLTRVSDSIKEFATNCIKSIQKIDSISEDIVEIYTGDSDDSLYVEFEIKRCDFDVNFSHNGKTKMSIFNQEFYIIEEEEINSVEDFTSAVMKYLYENEDLNLSVDNEDEEFQNDFHTNT